jgi:hypothetical protein
MVPLEGLDFWDRWFTFSQGFRSAFFVFVGFQWTRVRPVGPAISAGRIEQRLGAYMNKATERRFTTRRRLMHFR